MTGYLGRDHSQRNLRRRLRTETRLQEEAASVASKQMYDLPNLVGLREDLVLQVPMDGA